MSRLVIRCPLCDHRLDFRGLCGGCGFEVPEAVPSPGVACGRCGCSLVGCRTVGLDAVCESCGAKTPWISAEPRAKRVVWTVGRVVTMALVGLVAVPLCFAILLYALMAW